MSRTEYKDGTKKDDICDHCKQPTNGYGITVLTSPVLTLCDDCAEEYELNYFFLDKD